MPVAPPPRPLGWHYPDAGHPQTPSTAAVVMPTLLRPSIAQALESVFAQQDVERVQVVIGIDKPLDSHGYLQNALAERPPNVSALVLALPFSTSVRHGGVHEAHDGGSLRAILAFMANARHVAFLDDDNTWRPDHLSGLLEAIVGKPWAYSQRMLIDEETGEELGIDRWDSVGVDQGRLRGEGGMVDPNCMLIDKVKTGRALGRWAEGPRLHSDRAFFNAICHLSHGRVDEPTVSYRVRPTNVLYRLARDGIEF